MSITLTGADRIQTKKTEDSKHEEGEHATTKEDISLEEKIDELTKKVDWLIDWTKCEAECNANPFVVSETFCYMDCKKKLQIK